MEKIYLSKDDIQKGYSITKKYLKSKGIKIKTTLKDSKTKGAAEKAMEELLGEYLEIKRKSLAREMKKVQFENDLQRIRGNKYYDLLWETKMELHRVLAEKEKITKRLIGSLALITVLATYILYKSF